MTYCASLWTFSAASGYGTQSLRLGKDAIKDFDCCSLSLQPCRDPVITYEPHLYFSSTRFPLHCVVLYYMMSSSWSLNWPPKWCAYCRFHLFVLFSYASLDGYIYEKEAILQYILHHKTDIAKKMKVCFTLTINSTTINHALPSCQKTAHYTFTIGKQWWIFLKVCLMLSYVNVGIWEAETGSEGWGPAGVQGERESREVQRAREQHCLQADQPFHLRYDYWRIRSRKCKLKYNPVTHIMIKTTVYSIFAGLFV